MTKMSAEQVIEIRELYDAGEYLQKDGNDESRHYWKSATDNTLRTYGDKYNEQRNN